MLKTFVDITAAQISSWIVKLLLNKSRIPAPERKKETKHHISRAPEPGYSIEEKSAIVTSTFTIRQELNEATDSTS